MVASKSDLYEYENVKEEEGKNYSKKINALFKIASAKFNSGIDDLFESVAEEYLNKEEKFKENQILSTLNEYFKSYILFLIA